MFHIEFKKTLAFVLRKEREFLPNHIPRELKELYLTMTILNFALASGVIFEPIYLYSLGYPLYIIMLFYFGVYFVYFFLMPLGGKIIKQKGFEHGIMYGSVFLILYLIFLLSIPTHPIFFFLAIFAYALQKTLFWPGYHADFVYFSQAEERGREIGIIAILDALAFILGPLIGGVILGVFGFGALFTFMCFVILVSNIPIMTTREHFTPKKLSYLQPYKDLIDPRQRKYLIGHIGFGEELVALTVWPIFIFVTIQNYVSTGLAIATSTLITSLVILYIGRLTDCGKRPRVLHVGVIFVALSWFFRLFVGGASSVILVDFFSRTSKYVFSLPFFSGLYTHAIKTSIVRTVLFFEMSLTVGKMLAAGILAILFYLFGPEWWIAFVLGGIFSLLYFALDGHRRVETRDPSLS
ncbi:hypothetical protein HY621_03970 [Candidatus Uhrbacteria bacterium]|nr:hypothetical protein [Candidatus Uhrbacteria bacterium]